MSSCFQKKGTFAKKGSMRDTLVVIPTYNEIDNIEKLLRIIFALQGEFHILVVDDNSPDLTALKVKELIAEFPDQLFLEERKGKLGLGTAYIHGFKWACIENPVQL